MDSSTSLEDQRGRQCNVCYQAFSREGEHIPRILSCGHTYCTACLGKLVGKFCMGKICCPTCKADTSIPGMVNNVQKLAKNFAVLDILDGLEEAIRGNSLATNQMLLCNEHDNEPKKVYCLTDRVVICIYCQVYGAHKGHECQLVSHVASTNREILAQLEQDLTVQKQTLLPSWRNLQEISNAVQLKEEKLLREMRRHFDILRRKLCRREKEVAGHLKSLTSGKVLILRKQCRHIGELMDRVEQLKMACQSFISGPDYEIVLKMDSLKQDIENFRAELSNHDLSPCASNSLACDLPEGLQATIASHGAIVECQDPKKLDASIPRASGQSEVDIDQSMQNQTQGQQAAVPVPSQSQTQTQTQDQDQSQLTETSFSGPSGDEVNASPMGWQEEGMATNARGAAEDHTRRFSTRAARPRQRLQRPDVIIFDSVGELDEIDPSVCQVRPLCQCQANGSRGRCDLYVHSARHRCRARENSRNDEDTFQDVSDLSSDTSSSIASPDFSDVSDLDLDLPLRSAWANRGGWSSPHPSFPASSTTTNLPPPSRQGAGGEQAIRVSAREVVAEIDRGQRSQEVGGHDGGGAVGGPEEEGEEALSSSDEATPRNPEPGSTLPINGGTAQPSRVHIHPRPNMDPKCSVFNCSSQAATSAYVRCKSCSRVFCQNCVRHSNSARRCYKRPRGHSFICISRPPSSSSPNPASSTNNNNSNLAVSIALVTGTGSKSREGHRHHRNRRHHGYHHHSHHHHQHSARHQHQYSAVSSRRHQHHHQPLQQPHIHGNQDAFVHHLHHQRRECGRSRSRGQREGRQSQAAVESIFQDLII